MLSKNNQGPAHITAALHRVLHATWPLRYYRKRDRILAHAILEMYHLSLSYRADLTFLPKTSSESRRFRSRACLEEPLPSVTALRSALTNQACTSTVLLAEWVTLNSMYLTETIAEKQTLQWSNVLYSGDIAATFDCKPVVASLRLPASPLWPYCEKNLLRICGHQTMPKAY